MATPSIWLEISLDSPPTSLSGEKTPLRGAEQDTGALEVVACKNAHIGCVCAQWDFPLPGPGRAALHKVERSQANTHGQFRQWEAL